MTSLTAFCVESIYNKKKITRWLGDFHSLRSFVKYCFHHSKIKSISSRHRVISSIYSLLFVCVFTFSEGFSLFPSGFSLFLNGFGLFPSGFSLFPSGFGLFPSGFSHFPGCFILRGPHSKVSDSQSECLIS